MRLKLSRWLTWSLVLLVAAFSATTWWFFSNEPLTTLALDVSTESVRFKVTESRASTLVLPRARAEGVAGCLQAIELVLDRGAVVSYRRVQRGLLEIQVEGGSTLRHGSKEGTPGLRFDRSIELQLGGKGCAALATDTVRLPITGTDVVVGESLRWMNRSAPGAAMLLKGDLAIYARASADLFWVPLTWGPFQAHALYLATGMSVPAGSIIEIAPARGGGIARWSGFADVAFGDDDPPGMAARATAHTARAHIYLPGHNVVADKPSLPEEVALSLMARWVGDPNLQLAYGVVLGLTLILSTFAAVAALPFAAKEPHDQFAPSPPPPVVERLHQRHESVRVERRARRAGPSGRR